MKSGAFALMTILIAVMGCQSLCNHNDKPLKVLMIGNSFSVSCMQELPKVAKATGQRLDLASMCIGGCSFEKHWSNCTNTTEAFYPYSFSRNTCGRFSRARMNLPGALALDQWDVVTIQQCSHLSWKSESFHPYADNLIVLIRKLAPSAKIYIQETWSYTPWDKRLKKWKFDQDDMYARLKVAYADFASQYDLPVIHTGTAVQEWRRRLPVRYTENSFGGDVTGGGAKPVEEHFTLDGNGKWQPVVDVFHLNPRGEYLQALVWAVKLWDADLGGLDYHPNCVTDAEAKLMADIATEVK